MSAPSLVPINSPEAYERASEVYINLWQRVCEFTGTNNWLRFRPGPAVAEDLGPEEIDQIARVARDFRADWEKTEQLVRDHLLSDPTELTVFCDGLRDKGLEYAARADAMLPENLETAPLPAAFVATRK